ncbi:MAG: hypothetical protein GY852_10230, partial [bacterium]|nr:hypothetical protein [bacterium]
MIEDSLTQGMQEGKTCPDVVILYSGHNEFLDFDNYAMLRMEHSPWPWLLDGIRQSWLINEFFTQDKGYVVTRHRLVSYAGVKRRVKQRFQASLERVIRLCSEARVPLVLCNPASNLSYWPPVGKDAPELYEQAKGHTKSGDHDKALQYYTMA